MKKILISAYSMQVGGIETALVNLLKYLSKDEENDITLVLEKNEGIFLDEIPEGIHIEENYHPIEGGNTLVRKLKNFLRRQKFKKKYKNKFDFSASFATYSGPGSYVARIASKNSALWVHLNYMDFFSNEASKYKKFFGSLHAEEFKKLVFVSNYDRLVFNSTIPDLSKKTITCNNLIDYKKILKNAEEKVTDLKESSLPTFVNIGRHDEKQKKLSRIIDAAKKLSKEGYKYRVIFVGDGEASEKYKEMCRGMQNMIFLGRKSNPYPYMKKADCLVMSSDFEGFPVVWVEARILDKLIITTKVSDWNSAIEKTSAGIVTDISESGVYEGMKQFLDSIKETGTCKPAKFDAEKYNEEIKEKLQKIINGE